MCKTVTLKANAQKIITWICIWHQICTKSLLERQMLRKSSLGKCIWCQIVMYKIITWKANAKEIVTLKCVWQQICTKSLIGRQMLRKSLLENACGTTYVQNCYFAGKCSGNRYLKMHVAPHMCKTVTLQANAKEIITWKCIWHQICTKSLL